MKIKYRIFKGSRNVLGVLLRGTNYIAKKPPEHQIPPKIEDVIKYVKLLNNKNQYDWIFLATEDIIIRRQFIKAIGIKVKYLLIKREIFYNYTTKEYLDFNKNIKSNKEFNKIYLLNFTISNKNIVSYHEIILSWKFFCIIFFQDTLGNLFENIF